MKSLIKLSNYYGSDKGTTTPKKGWGRPHNYADIYQAYFYDLQDQDINILEIGAGVVGPNWETGIVGGRNTGGASLKMWYDFFPKANIYSIDINDAKYLDNDRIKTFLADQSSTESLNNFIEKLDGIQFDIIIDDGSHNPEHQQISLGILFKILKPNGLYFIEDLLKNGKGDNSKRRNASDKVLNTKCVLENWCNNGALASPNLIVDQDHFEKNVKYINFHCPRINIIENDINNARLKDRCWFEYDDDYQMLCAIKKKS